MLWAQEEVFGFGALQHLGVLLGRRRQEVKCGGPAIAGGDEIAAGRCCGCLCGELLQPIAVEPMPR